MSTVPLLFSGCGFEGEDADQVEGGVTQGQAADASPEVAHVSLLAAGGVEAVEDVLFQVNAESAAAAVAAVDRARAAALRSAAAQAQADVIGDPSHR
jgi:hypothetical protein